MTFALAPQRGTTTMSTQPALAAVPAPTHETVTVNVPEGFIVMIVSPDDYIRGRTRRDVNDGIVQSNLTPAQRQLVRTALDLRDERKAQQRLDAGK